MTPQGATGSPSRQRLIEATSASTRPLAPRMNRQPEPPAFHRGYQRLHKAAGASCAAGKLPTTKVGGPREAARTSTRLPAAQQDLTLMNPSPWQGEVIAARQAGCLQPRLLAPVGKSASPYQGK